jgi:hypothetical protein
LSDHFVGVGISFFGNIQTLIIIGLVVKADEFFDGLILVLVE